MISREKYATASINNIAEDNAVALSDNTALEADVTAAKVADKALDSISLAKDSSTLAKAIAEVVRQDMIVFELAKVGNISYVSHIDYMRILQRALGRAGLAAALSNGFNRHPVTYCSHPLPVGVQSVSEYFSFKPSQDYTMAQLQAFAFALPRGIEVKAIYRMALNPNIAGKVIECAYRVAYSGSEEHYNIIKNAVSGESVIMTFDSKGENKSIDIAPLLHGLECNGNELVMQLATGNPTLRPDKIIEFFNLLLDGKSVINICDAVRFTHLLMHDGNAITAHDLLEKNCIEKYTY